MGYRVSDLMLVWSCSETLLLRVWLSVVGEHLLSMPEALDSVSIHIRQTDRNRDRE